MNHESFYTSSFLPYNKHVYCMTMSISVLRAYFVKKTWSTLMKTSEKTLNHVRQISSLKPAGREMIRFVSP